MLDKLLGFVASGWVNKPASDDYWYQPRGAETTSGADIDEDSAMAIATVFACVSKICKTLASLPVDVVEKVSPRQRNPVDHPLEELLDGKANDESSGFTIREAMEANIDLWGKTFVQVNYRGREPDSLAVLPSRDTELRRDEDGKPFAYYRPEREVIPWDRLWYVPGLSTNGLAALSPVAYNRESLGLAMTATQFGAAFFGNGAWAGGFFSRPLDAPELSLAKGEEFLSSINEKFRGARKAFGFGLLREGMEFKQIDMPFEDAMFLGTRQFERVEICGMFDVPPPMIQDYSHATYSNTEQADLAFAKHSMLPRCIRIEKSARAKFFSGTKLQLKHNLAGLVRGDFKTRMEAYALGRQWGIWSINDCRAMEDLNPIDGGDEYLTPLNMISVGQQRPTQIPATAELVKEIASGLAEHNVFQGVSLQKPDETPPDWSEVLKPGIQHAAERIVTKQTKATLGAWTKHAKNGRRETFTEWADGWFVQHAEHVRSELEPIWASWESATGFQPDRAARDLAGELCREWQLAVVESLDAADGVPGLVDLWKVELAGRITEAVCGALRTEELSHAA